MQTDRGKDVQTDRGKDVQTSRYRWGLTLQEHTAAEHRRVSQTIADLIAIRARVLLKIMHGGLQTHYVTVAQVAQVTTNSVGCHLAAVKVI